MWTRALLFIFIQGVFFIKCAFADPILYLNPQKVKELLLSQGIGAQLLRLSLETERQELPKAKGRYDTDFTFEGDHTIDQSAKISRFFGTRTDTSHWDLGFEKLVPSGTTLGLLFQTERKKVFSPSSVVGIPTEPTFEPSLNFQLKQSLGNNFLGSLDRAEIKGIQYAIEAFDFQTQHQLRDLIYSTLSLYWSFALSKEAEIVAQKSLEEAIRFGNVTGEKEKLGLVEPSDRLGALAIVAKRKAFLAGLQTEILEWEAKLKTVLNLPRERALSTGASSFKFPSFDEEEAIALAFQGRFDLKSLKQELEQKNIEIVIAKKKKLPTIDLENTLKLNEIQINDYEGALGDMDSPTWKIGLQLKLPLENRQAKARQSQARLEAQKTLLKLKEKEQEIIHDVSQKLKAVGLAQRVLEAREKEVRLQRQKLDYALDQYERARFSADLILKFQDDYLDAKMGRLKAKQNLALSLLSLQQAMATEF